MRVTIRFQPTGFTCKDLAADQCLIQYPTHPAVSHSSQPPPDAWTAHRGFPPDVARVVFGYSWSDVVIVGQQDCEVVGLHQLELGAQQAIREPAVRAAHVGVHGAQREVSGVLGFVTV